MRVIIDASVAIKWFNPEEDSEKANDLLRKVNQEKITVIVPRLFYYEMGNIFLLSKNETLKNAQEKYEKLLKLEFQVKETLFEKIYEIARKYTTSFYDAVYLSLAEEELCHFITADKKLFTKIQKDFSKAMLLSSYTSAIEDF